MHIDWK